MKTLATLAALPFMLSSCMILDLQWEQGDGVAVTEVRSLPSFSRIRSDAPVHVTIRTGNEYAAYVTSDGNLSGYFLTDTYGGTLTIGLATAIQPIVEPEIVVVVPNLRAVTHNGDGLVEIEEGGDFPEIDLTLNGNGELRFFGTASTLRATLNGSGDILMDGYAGWLVADSRGMGEIRGEYLLAGDADVELSGSGNVFLDLDYQSVLNLTLSGSGNVEWWGAPSRLDYTLTGTGRVVEHRGLPKQTAGAKKTATAKTAATSLPYEMAAPRVLKPIRFSEATGKAKR